MDKHKREWLRFFVLGYMDRHYGPPVVDEIVRLANELRPVTVSYVTDRDVRAVMTMIA